MLDSIKTYLPLSKLPLIPPFLIWILGFPHALLILLLQILLQNLHLHLPILSLFYLFCHPHFQPLNLLLQHLLTLVLHNLSRIYSHLQIPH